MIDNAWAVLNAADDREALAACMRTLRGRGHRVLLSAQATSCLLSRSREGMLRLARILGQRCLRTDITHLLLAHRVIERGLTLITQRILRSRFSGVRLAERNRIDP